MSNFLYKIFVAFKCLNLNQINVEYNLAEKIQAVALSGLNQLELELESRKSTE